MGRISALSLLVVSALAAQAQDVGLGLSVRGNDTTISIPWNVKPGLRLEGSLKFGQYRTDFNLPPAGTPSSSFTITRDEFSSYSLGLAAFAVKSLGSSYQVYAGPRLSFMRNRMESHYAYLSSDGPVAIGTSETHSRGVSLAGLVGLEYFFSKNLSLSAEAGISHGRWDNHVVSGWPEQHVRQTESISALVARYYF